MYKKECKWCKVEIIVEKQPNFASHVATCEKNPNFELNKIKSSLRLKGVKLVVRKKLKKECPECGTGFEVEATESEIRRNKVKNYCSRKCGNKRTHSDETKNKISNSLKTGGNMFIPDNKGKSYKNRFRLDIDELNQPKKSILQGTYDYLKLPRKIDGEYLRYNEFTCLKCGEIGTDKKYNKNRRYHLKCWLSISGGIKEGSSRSKHGWYKGYWCDSSYELAYLIYNLENGIKIERNKEGFEYCYNNKKHLFYPDFIVNGEYVEIKNFRSELTDCKINNFPHEIKIYYRDTINVYLDYVKNKYGKDFIKLYE